jgi:hypothetical protein
MLFSCSHLPLHNEGTTTLNKTATIVSSPKVCDNHTCWVLLITWCIFHIHNILEYTSTPFFRWLVTIILVKVKQSQYRHRGFQEADTHRIQDNRNMKVVRLSALCNGCLYLPGNPTYSAFMFLSFRIWTSFLHWVDFPALSQPSNTIMAPLL